MKHGSIDLFTDSIIIDNDNHGTNNDRVNESNSPNSPNNISKSTNDESTIRNFNIEHLNNDIIVNIFRYKFTNEFMTELFVFSKIHQYDKRSDFKEAWEKWIHENSELVDSEVRRIINLGYDGNVVDKMYKSARYYFRKKSTEKKAPKDRRIYINIQKDLLNSIDRHILININNGPFAI